MRAFYPYLVLSLVIGQAWTTADGDVKSRCLGMMNMFNSMSWFGGEKPPKVTVIPPPAPPQMVYYEQPQYVQPGYEYEYVYGPGTEVIYGPPQQQQPVYGPGYEVVYGPIQQQQQPVYGPGYEVVYGPPQQQQPVYGPGYEVVYGPPQQVIYTQQPQQQQPMYNQYPVIGNYAWNVDSYGNPLTTLPYTAPGASLYSLVPKSIGAAYDYEMPSGKKESVFMEIRGKVVSRISKALYDRYYDIMNRELTAKQQVVEKPRVATLVVRKEVVKKNSLFG